MMLMIRFIHGIFSIVIVKKIFKKAYSKDLITSYLVMGITIIIPLVLTPMLLNKLGAEQYGLWILLTTILAYFQLSNLGLSTTLLKEISDNKNFEDTSKLISTTIFFFLIVFFIVSFIFLFLFLNINSFFQINENLITTARGVFILMFIIFGINLIASIFDNILFAKKLLYVKNLIILVSTLASAIFTIVILELGYGLIEIALINLSLSIITGILYFFISSKITKFKITYKLFDFALLKSMFKPSIYYFIISVSIMVSFYSDNIIISSYIGLGSVAIYAVAYKVVKLVEQIIFKITDILFPDISRMYKNAKYSELLAKHNKVLLYSMFLAISGYGFLLLFGTKIIALWVGAKYTIDLSVFYYLIAFAFVHTWNHVSSVFIMAMGLHKEVSYSVLIEAILNVILSIILLKYYGLAGVAMGTFFAHILTNNWFVVFWFYKNIYRLKNAQIKKVVND